MPEVQQLAGSPPTSSLSRAPRPRRGAAPSELPYHASPEEVIGTMGFKTSGKIHAISEAQQVTERFRKREFVVELADNPRYPQYVQFQLTGDRCENLDGFDVGDEVQVEFSLRGREWKSPKGDLRYFNSLDVWEIQRRGDSRGMEEEPPLPDGPPVDEDEEIPF